MVPRPDGRGYPPRAAGPQDTSARDIGRTTRRSRPGRGALLAEALIGLTLALSACTSCPTALIEGVLIADGPSHLVIAEAGVGQVRTVDWPTGYAVRPDGPRLVLVDVLGNVVAREGDHVRLAGGEMSTDGPWKVCGGITVTPPD